MKKKLFTVIMSALLVASQIPASTISAEEVQAKDLTRYSVLVLDSSGSMRNRPITALKQAAKTFCENVTTSNGTNYVAIVRYSNNGTVVCDFTDKYEDMTSAIDQLNATGGTNIQGALQTADGLLDKIENNSNVVKNIVLLSDGLPENGEAKYEGYYTASDYSGYAYANSAYDAAADIKAENTYIYTLGFFHSLSGTRKAFCERFMNDLQNAGYYNVDNPDDLNFVFGEIAGAITKINGTFMYPCKHADYNAEFFYDDSYFMKSAYNPYNEHLATMSLCLELSVWPSIPYVEKKDYAGSSVNAEKLLNTIGFENFRTNTAYQTTPTEDSIGVGIAKKQIVVNNEPVTLLAVAVRGGGYEKEWASNFKIGANGDAQGFSEAKGQVLDFLRTYISEEGITGKVKFWVTGYSRGAATANLTAAALDDGISYPNVSYEAEDVYAYTFETPMGTVNPNAHSETYNNIHNIVNPNDVVPMVAPEAWEFDRYGQDHTLPSAVSSGNSDVKKMLEKYNGLASTAEYKSDKDPDTYKLDDFATYYIKVDGWKFLPGGDPLISIQKDENGQQSAFLNSFMGKFANTYAKSRSNYVANYQDHICYVLGTIMGLTEAETSAVMDSITSKLSRDELVNIFSPCFNPINDIFKSQQVVNEIYKNISNLLGDALKDNQIAYDQDKLDKAVASLMSLVLNTGTNELNDTITLINTFSCIGNAHYPELCLAWMQSQDSYYSPQGKIEFSKGAYRIIRINCPVDVKVFDKSGNLVAYLSDVNESTQEYELVCTINENGEKLIYVPVDSDYTFEIVANDDGKVSVTVDEVNEANGNVTRIVDFNDVELKKGEKINGTLPAFTDTDVKNIPDGSSVNYSMTDPNGTSVGVQEERKGDTAKSSYYTVSFNKDKAPLGVLMGSGAYLYGSYAQVEAIPAEDCTFTGWFEADQLVSTDAKYRFKVTKDVELTPHFDSAEKQLTVEATQGGKVEGVKTGSYHIGDICTIKAVPESGYRFVEWRSEQVLLEAADLSDTRMCMPGTDSKLTAVFESVNGQTSAPVAAPSVDNRSASDKISNTGSLNPHADQVAPAATTPVPAAKTEKVSSANTTKVDSSPVTTDKPLGAVIGAAAAALLGLAVSTKRKKNS